MTCQEDKRGFYVVGYSPGGHRSVVGARLREQAQHAVVSWLHWGTHPASFIAMVYDRDQISHPYDADESPTERNGSSSCFTDKYEGCLGLLGTWGRGEGVVCFFPLREKVI